MVFIPHRTLLLALVPLLLVPLAPSAGWAKEHLRIGGTGSALGVVRLLAEAYRKHHGALDLELPESLGSGGGIRATGAGAIDIGLSSRPLKPHERKLGVQSRAFARTPFVLVTGASRPRVTRLTSAQVHEIFTGRRTEWDDGSLIHLILRPKNDSDTRILVRRFIPEGLGALAPVRRRRGVALAATDQNAADLAERVPGAVTTSTLALIRSERRRVIPINIDGVAPSLKNLESGAYDLHKTLYTVTRTHPRRAVRKFIAFVYSRRGARVMRKAGCLPIAGSGEG